MKFFKKQGVAIGVLLLVVALSCGYKAYRTVWQGAGALPADPSPTSTVTANTPAASLPAVASPEGAYTLKEEDSYYVDDGANVLRPSTKQHILTANGLLEQQTGGQIVVVTVASLNGEPSDEVALELFNQRGVGSEGRNNGMLLLLSPYEKKGWLLQGDGIRTSFTNDIGSQYLDTYFWDLVDAGEYDAAVGQLFDALIRWYESYYRVQILDDTNLEYTPSVQVQNSGFFSSLFSFGSDVAFGALIFVLVVVALIIAAIVLIVRWIFGRGPRNRAYYSGGRMPFFFFISPWRNRPHTRRPPPGPGPFPGGPGGKKHWGPPRGGFSSGGGAGRGGSGRSGGFSSGGGSGRR